MHLTGLLMVSFGTIGFFEGVLQETYKKLARSRRRIHSMMTAKRNIEKNLGMAIWLGNNFSFLMLPIKAYGPGTLHPQEQRLTIMQ